MVAITFEELDQKKGGAFFISDNGVRIGEMAVSRQGNVLTIYHTEIIPEAEGKGFAKQLFEHMIDYAGREGLMVKPHCTFVYSMLKKDPERYDRIWLKTV